MLASSPRVPARNPAAAPLNGPVLTMTPATSPAIKGPTCGRAAPMMRLIKNPTPIARRRSAVLSSDDGDRFLAMRAKPAETGAARSDDILRVTSYEPIWLHSQTH